MGAHVSRTSDIEVRGDTRHARVLHVMLQEDPELQNDPLSKLDLAAYVEEQLRGLYHRDETFFNYCCSQLGPAQLAAVKQCFQQ